MTLITAYPFWDFPVSHIVLHLVQLVLNRLLVTINPICYVAQLKTIIMTMILIATELR